VSQYRLRPLILGHNSGLIKLRPVNYYIEIRAAVKGIWSTPFGARDSVVESRIVTAGLDVKGKKQDLVDRVWSKLDKAPEEIDLDTRSMRYPEVVTKKLPDKLKTHFYHACFARAQAQDDETPLLCKDIINAADHWAGSHSICAELDPQRKCVVEQWGPEKAHYLLNGETHLAVKAWLVKKASLAKMKFYTRARQNFLSETFNSVINKYASKRIHYAKSHIARIQACAGLDCSEGRDRVVLAKKQRQACGTAVRTRGANRNILSEKTTRWKTKVSNLLSLS
jgi:hypothetical protein